MFATVKDFTFPTQNCELPGAGLDSAEWRMSSIVSRSYIPRITEYISKTSTYSLRSQFLSINSVVSLTYKIKNSDPMTMPWITPLNTSI